MLSDQVIQIILSIKSGTQLLYVLVETASNTFQERFYVPVL